MMVTAEPRTEPTTDLEATMDVIRAALGVLLERTVERMTDGGNSIIHDHQQRITTLERERALLLRYVRAQHAYGRALIARGEPFPEDWEPFPGSIAERAAAWDAIRDAGLLAGDDDAAGDGGGGQHGG